MNLQKFIIALTLLFVASSIALVTIPVHAVELPKLAKPIYHYLCTGFFITATGEVGTAGHCAGTNMTMYFTINHVLVSVPIHIVAIDTNHDSMIVGPEKPLNVVFFPLNMALDVTGAGIAYIGYPNPDKYGYFRHTYAGSIRYYNAKDGMYISNIFSDHGSSGSGVYGQDSSVIGILTDGYELGNIWIATGIRPISSLIVMALAHDLPIKLVTQTNLGPVTDKDLPYLYNLNLDKVVLITGDISDAN